MRPGVKSVVLVLSEKAAKQVEYWLSYTINGIDPDDEQSQVESDVLHLVIAEIAAQLHRNANTNHAEGERSPNSDARRPIGFDDYDEIAANMPAEWPEPERTPAGTKSATRKRQTKAEKIAAEMAAKTREAVEGV